MTASSARRIFWLNQQPDPAHSGASPVLKCDSTGNWVDSGAHININPMLDLPGVQRSIAKRPGAGPIILWSGTPESDLFARSPRAWLMPADENLTRLCDQLSALAQTHNCRILLRPHARHILSDIPRCLRFLQNKPASLGLALDPIAMLEPSMLRDWEDHLARILQSLAPLSDALFISNIARAPDPDSDAALTSAPLHTGFLPPDKLRAHFSPALHANLDLIFLGADPDRQHSQL